MLFHDWSDTVREYRGDGEPHDVDVERKAGVYVPTTEIDDGTVVQNDDEALRELVRYATVVAVRAAGHYADRGLEILGVGKNHDATLIVFVDDNVRLKGRRLLTGTPFVGCTVMGLPIKWWETYPDDPTLHWLPDEAAELTE